MIDIEIPPEYREAWQREVKLIQDGHAVPRAELIDAIVWAIAGWAESNFDELHRDHDVTRECLGCGSTDDPRHKWTPDRWREEVRKTLIKDRW